VCAILCFEIMLQFREYTEVNPETNKGVSRDCKGDRSLPLFRSQTKVASHTRARYRGAHSISHTHTLVASICSSKQPPTRPGPTCSAAKHKCDEGQTHSIRQQVWRTQSRTYLLGQLQPSWPSSPAAPCACCSDETLRVSESRTGPNAKGPTGTYRRADTLLARESGAAGPHSATCDTHRRCQRAYCRNVDRIQSFAGSTQRGSRTPGCGRAY